MGLYFTVNIRLYYWSLKIRDWLLRKEGPSNLCDLLLRLISLLTGGTTHRSPLPRLDRSPKRLVQNYYLRPIASLLFVSLLDLPLSSE